MRSKIDYVFNSNTGQMVLIAMESVNSWKLSLCNVYGPKSQSEQMNFLQELMYLLINQSFLQLVATGTALSQKKDQVGGTVRQTVKL